MRSGIAGSFKISENTGYQWWYDKYRFTDRIKKIHENNKYVIDLLKSTYDDMAVELSKQLERKNLKQNSDCLNKLKKKVTTIRDRFPIIQQIFHNNGIPENQFDKIIFNFKLATETVESLGED
ncbi:MAG: hypothetical protein H0W50_09380 [Parachlamydiaceae bacterium]|nr:hypothetical protein [Parachlamydiaceae bacterium]